MSYLEFKAVSRMNAGYKPRGVQVKDALNTYSNSLRVLCHATGCKWNGCPEMCACKKVRANPLDLETAIIWKVADVVGNLSGIYYQFVQRNSFVNYLRFSICTRNCYTH